MCDEIVAPETPYHLPCDDVPVAWAMRYGIVKRKERLLHPTSGPRLGHGRGLSQTGCTPSAKVVTGNGLRHGIGVNFSSLIGTTLSVRTILYSVPAPSHFSQIRLISPLLSRACRVSLTFASRAGSSFFMPMPMG